MKSFTQGLAMLILLNTTACIASYSTPNAPGPRPMGYGTSPQQVQISLQVFYDQLSPYGTWVSYNNYGYVWIPSAGPDFFPYASEGHWVFTNIGWTWYSNYSWGWAPFHYGRWLFDNYYGWIWVPDTEWGPAWVVWRGGGDYYGWAPLEPGINISIVLGGNHQVHHDRWIFVRNGDIGRSNVYSYTVNRTSNTTIINNTTVIQNTRTNTQNNKTYIAGPDRNDVQRVTGRPVRQVAIQEATQPGQMLKGDQLRIYKPAVQRNGNSGQKSAPAKIENLKNVKPVNERPKVNSQQGKQSPAKGKGNQEKPAKKKGKKGGNKGHEYS